MLSKDNNIDFKIVNLEIQFQKLKSKINSAPLLPGCYIYKDREGQILYIGKANELRSRVKSYFLKNADLLPRIKLMVEKIWDVDFVTVDSEVEALVLETNLIHKYRPKYNSDKKDDKNYQWLKFSKFEDFKYPLLAREKKTDNAKYFGPYPQSLPLTRTLKYLRKVFPYRTCNRKIEEIHSKNNSTVVKSSDPKPCLYYHLGLCPAPCAGKISKKEYSKNIKHLQEYFAQRKEYVIYKLREEMALFSKDKNFEAAAIIRDKVSDLLYISQRIEVENNIDEQKFILNRNLSKINALSELIDIVGDEGLEFKENFKIECYDISNIQGKLAVGSMVVFINGVPAKQLYRKFKIKTKDTPDDFAMMQEVFGRRFSQKNLKSKDQSFNSLPDLIIVDGGKGQLSSAYKILRGLELTTSIIGLAKRNEDIFTISKLGKKGIVFTKKILKEASEPRFLMQRIRDEAHRFGITYHRNLRLKAQKFSIINTIPGVGKILGTKLLKAFGSLDGIKKATEKELYQVIKNKKTVHTIRNILNYK
jgi:excinuclease ABC subunit C